MPWRHLSVGLYITGSDARHEVTSQAAAWSLPDGDDLLGLSSHTPGQTPATPVQDGGLDRSGLNAAAVQPVPHSPGWYDTAFGSGKTSQQCS